MAAKLKKCVVVLSGGLDSSTVAYWAKAQGYQIFPITFKYGQIAEKETQAAQTIAQSLATTTKIIDLSALKGIFSGTTSLVNSEIPLTAEFSAPIIVPFRIAISRADLRDSKTPACPPGRHGPGSRG